MPLSKPVKKQQFILPGPKEFHQLSKDKKENILKRLSTDNLILYLEYIVASFHTPTKADCFTLEQIVEEDVRIGSNQSDEDNYISEWITKNSNRSTDMEASLLDQDNFAMTSTKTITQTLLGSPSPLMEQHSSKSESRLGKAFQDVSNFSSNSSLGASGGQKLPGDTFYSVPSYTSTPLMPRSSRVKSAWENVLQPSSQASRWQSSYSSGKENTPQFKAAIERPSSSLDLRFSNDSSPHETAFFQTKSGSGFSKSFITKPTLTHNFMQDSFLPNQSSYSQNYGLKPLGGGGNAFDSPMDNGFAVHNYSAAPSVRSGRSEYGNNTSLLNGSMNSNGLYSYKQGQNMDQDKFSSYDPLFAKQQPTKPVSTLGRSELFGGGPVKNLESAFASAMTEPAADLSVNFKSIALEIKDPDLLKAFNLPEPSVFNEMPAESRTKILNSLPSNVKNKYEYFCWSYKLNQLYNERPTGSN